MSEETSLRQRGRVWGLFWQFFKIGCYTFGGGWSIVAQMQKEYVEKRGWLTEEDLLDITSVGRSLPGLMIGNVSYLFGYHVAGFPGAVACVIVNLVHFLIHLKKHLVLKIFSSCYVVFNFLLANIFYNFTFIFI